MKTPRFWYPENPAEESAAPFLLSPFSLLFAAGARVRRALAFRPYRAKIPVICLGNAVAGGAGKTPAALALARMLKDRKLAPVFVTRGYGGTGKLARVDLAYHGAKEVGDEALLLAEEAPTWVARDRRAALREAEKEGSVIIMDDGLQNPHIAPSASLLVIDGEVGIGNGRLIPAGPLRESIDHIVMRTTAVLIVGENDRQGLGARIKAPLFRARLRPHLPPDFPRAARFVAFAGIARPQKFYATARAAGLRVVATHDFADHRVYSAADIAALRKEADAQGALLLTTEKDAVRLPPSFRKDVLALPVRLAFESPQTEKSLISLLLNKI